MSRSRPHRAAMARGHVHTGGQSSQPARARVSALADRPERGAKETLPIGAKHIVGVLGGKPRRAKTLGEMSKTPAVLEPCRLRGKSRARLRGVGAGPFA